MDPQKRIDGVTESFKSLKTQIKEAKRELEGFDEGTQEFEAAAQKVANLSDKVDDLNDKIKLVKGDALERVAGGIKGIGGAILDLDVGRLQMANQSLSSIPFKNLMGNAKAFGKELFKLATNPLFLIPTLISLIIANFDKLLKIFPGLGKVVDGVKVIFEKLGEGILDIINWAGEMYEKFKPIINVLFPITGLIEGIIDLISEQADSAEESAKRRIEAEEKYKDSIEKSKKTIEKSKRETAVLLGKLSEEEAKKQELKENFITNVLKINEEARKELKKDYSDEEKAEIEKKRKLDLDALNAEYAKETQVIIQAEKKKAKEAEKVKSDASKKAEDKRKTDEEKRKADELKNLTDFNNLLRKAQQEDLDEFDKLESEKQNRILELETKFQALSKEDQKLFQQDFNNERLRLEQDYLTKRTELGKANLQTEIDRVNEENNELLRLQAENNEKVKAEQEKLIQDQIRAEQNLVAAKRGALDTSLNIAAQFAGKNKALAIGVLAVQKGLAISDVVVNASKSIASTIANTAAANAAAIAVSPLTGGLPFTAINTASALKNITATKIGAATSIANILAQGIGQAKGIISGGQVPSVGGSAGGTPTGGGGPRQGSDSLSGINDAFTIGGQPIGGLNMNNQNNQNNQMLKVFVTETDISNVQNKVKVTESDALFK